jgi:Hint domain
LVAAKHLSVAGVHIVQSSGTTYIHFLCDRHEVVLVDGIWTESFQPEDHSLKSIGNAQRLEIYEIFPELKTEAGRTAFPAARPIVTATDLVERMS